MEEPIEMGEDALKISYAGPSENKEMRDKADEVVSIVQNTNNRCLV